MIFSLGSARNAHVLMYAALALRWPPRTHFVRRLDASEKHIQVEIFERLSHCLSDKQCALFSIFSLFQIVKEHNC